MIASATEIVAALGQLDHLVGRSHECDFPAAVLDLPICTRPRIPVHGDSAEIDRLVKAQLREAVSVYEVFPDVLERLQPTHILTQTQCEVCAVSLRDVEEALGLTVSGRPEVVPLHPNALADVWEDIRRVAQAIRCERQGETLLASLQGRINHLSTRAQAYPVRPRVACIEWLEPLMAAGNWVPELVGLAGGINLFGEAGRHSPWMQWEDLASADPDVLFVMPCGWDPERTAPEMHWLTDRPGWSGLKAVQNGRVHVVDGNQYFNRPGPRLVDSLEILIRGMYPETEGSPGAYTDNRCIDC